MAGRKILVTMGDREVSEGWNRLLAGLVGEITVRCLDIQTGCVKL